ncbi:hypothetical protein FGRMN_6645 [Fusarium graminum]|nr:hypothetical protein FGRMN_6645 [Fusarium graminum]
MTGLRYDPEYLKAIEPLLGGPKPEPAKTVLEIRENTNAVIRRVIGASSYPSNVAETVYTIKTYDGAEIEVTRFATKETLASNKRTPAVIYFHGGAYVACSVQLFARQIAGFANRYQLPFFAVSYRLAPEHPAPAGVEDGYAAVQYLIKSASELNIDPTKIILYGDSAGGGIAAGVALMARDRSLQPPIAKQLLVYPMLDDRYHVEKSNPVLELMVWGPDAAKLVWDSYASKVRDGGDEQAVSYAIPARATSLKGLPSTYIDVGSLDLFRDDNLGYAKRLLDDNVEVEFHLWPGLPHGFDGITSLSWYDRAQESRFGALKRV